MKKYIVIETNKYGDEWVSAFDTLEDANEYAKKAWGRLSAHDKKEQSVIVGIVTENDLTEWAVDEDTGEIDWTSYAQYDYSEECFDIEVLKK